MPDLDIPFDIVAVENLPPYLRTPEVAKLMRKSENAVVQDRYLHRGPPFIRVGGGRRILYDRDQVLAYLRQHTVQPDDQRNDDSHPASASATEIEPPLRT
jgi:hypothetical protein